MGILDVDFKRWMVGKWLRTVIITSTLITFPILNLALIDLNVLDHWCKALSTPAGSARWANIVPITRSNTQGGKGSGRHQQEWVGANNKTKDSLATMLQQRI